MSRLCRIDRIEDPQDPSLFYTKLVDIKQDITDARENPWAGQLRPVVHEDGALVSMQQINACFDLVPSTMLTVPAKLFPDDLRSMTEEDFQMLRPVPTFGRFISRSDTLEVVGWVGLRGACVAPLACGEKFWKLCSESGFRVESAGMVHNNSVLMFFARHTGEPVQIGGNRFVRYAYFMTAFGSGVTPLLVHAAFHTNSGCLFLVDVQKIGMTRVRGMQTSRRSTLGADEIVSKFHMNRWDSDWEEYRGILLSMSETVAIPSMLDRILALSYSLGSREIQGRVAQNISDYARKYPHLRQRLDRTKLRWKDSYIQATPGTMGTLLGAFLFVTTPHSRRSDALQEASFVTECSASGLTRKRIVYNMARRILLEKA